MRVIDREALRARLWPILGYEPHPGQSAIHASTARHKVAACGRRFGKSYIGGHELVLEAVIARLMLPKLEATGQRREFWIIGPEYTDSEKEFRYLYNGLKRIDAPFDRPGTYNDPHGGDMRVSLHGGKFIVIGKSAKYPQTLVGEGLNGVIMAEAAKIKPSVWMKFVRPMLADHGGWSLHTSTPEGRNWFHKNYDRGQSSLEPDWQSWRMPSWLNPRVYPLGATSEAIKTLRLMYDMRQVAVTADMMRDLGVDPEIGSLMRDMSRETFNSEICAEFTEFVGRVYKAFDEDIHVRDLTYDTSLPTFLACDFGFTNPFVALLIQVDPYRQVRVIKEYRDTQMTINEHIAVMRSNNFIPDSCRELFPDPESPSDAKSLAEAFKLRIRRNCGGPLSIRIKKIRDALAEQNQHLPIEHAHRRAGLVIDRSCIGLIGEMGMYRYPQTAEEAAEKDKQPSEAPLKKDDHGPEALSRFFGAYLLNGKSGTTIREARYS
jgi:hypothetical protein